MSEFAWHTAETLWLLLLLPLLSLLFGRRGRVAAILFSSTAIAKNVAGRSRNRAGRFLVTLRLLALALLIVALAGPRSVERIEQQQASGVDIVLVLDISQSMAALDFTEDAKNIQTRLDVVKETVEDFIRKRPNDRIGIIAFADNPYVLSPLTLNHDWLLKNLERLELGLVQEYATAIGTAIGSGVNRLKDLESKTRLLILLTDGEDTVGTIPPTAAAEAAAAENVKIYTIAAGREGRVPVAQTDRNNRVVRDRDGQPIVSRFHQNSSVDTKTLREIARIANGQFYSARNKKELEKIYTEIDELEKTEVDIIAYAEYEELFIWPALAGLALLLLEQLLANTRLRRLP